MQQYVPLKTKSYFCYDTQFSLFTLHVYENLLKDLTWLKKNNFPNGNFSEKHKLSVSEIP